MYKDKGKQREAIRKAVQRHRAKQGITSSAEGITSYIKELKFSKAAQAKGRMLRQ